ncbi:hypothetical protein DMUE_4145 [Dictyocoela muelleri]|nr:hypothetical protein DMUE_4145 [Dictyocoela muelleri]
MDRSFTLNLNPISVKTIKEYEKELESLKAENFELKHRLSQQPAELKKLINDSERSINILEEENQKLKSVVGNSLQDENDRLYEHIEVLNNRVTQLNVEKSRLEDVLKDLESENNELKNKNYVLNGQIEEFKNEIINLKNQNSQFSSKCREFENLISSNVENSKHQIHFDRILNEREQSLKDFEKKLNLKNEELCRKEVELDEFAKRFGNVDTEIKIREDKISDLEFEIRHLNSNLDETLDQLEKYKEMCRKGDFEIQEKTKRIRELEDAVMRNEREQMNLLQKVENEYEERIKQNETFMTIPRLLKVSEFVTALKMINYQIETIYSKIEIIEKSEKLNDKNLRFLQKLEVKGVSKNTICSKNNLVSQLRQKFKFMNRKNIELEKEIAEINDFVRNNKNVLHEKTISLLNEFGDELESAKRDLFECQEYLLRKSDEIKRLKKENKNLSRQIVEYREEKKLLLNKYVNVMEKFKVGG